MSRLSKASCCDCFCPFLCSCFLQWTIFAGNNNLQVLSRWAVACSCGQLLSYRCKVRDITHETKDVYLYL